MNYLYFIISCAHVSDLFQTCQRTKKPLFSSVARRNLAHFLKFSALKHTFSNSTDLKKRCRALG